MKRFFRTPLLPLVSLGGGLITLILRLILLSQADSTGLLPVGHFAGILSWVITVAVLVYLLIGTRSLNEAKKYAFNFPADPLAAGGILAAALGILITSISELIGSTDLLCTICSVFGFLCVPALAFLSQCRKSGRRPSVLFHALVCVYLMLHLVSHYRVWSAYPQIQTYGFDLLALVCLMLASYQRCVFDINRGSRRAYVFTSLSGAFFSIAALPGSSNVLFFLGCAIWMLTGLCSLRPLPGRYASKES